MTGSGKDSSVRALATKLGDQGEAILSAILATTSECIKIVARDGSLLYMNSAGLQMVGAGDDEAPEDSCVFDVIAPEDRGIWIANHQRVCDGERLTWQFDMIDSRGTRHNMETKCRSAEDAGRHFRATGNYPRRHAPQG